MKHKVIGWDQLGSFGVEGGNVWVISSCDSYQVCKRTAAYGITRRARNARDADENRRR